MKGVSNLQAVPSGAASTPTILLQVVPAATAQPGCKVTLNPVDASRLAASVDDWLSLSADHANFTFAQLRIDPEVLRGQIAMNGLQRGNAGTSLDGTIMALRAEPSVAHSAVLELVRSGPAFHLAPKRTVAGWLLGLIGRSPVQAARGALPDVDLTGQVVMTGNHGRIQTGAEVITFTVRSTVPDGPVAIDATTEISLVERGRDGGAVGLVSYDDVGGLGHEIARVREMVELPIRYPELFVQLGIDPPKGILFHGPPGSGKTLIARAVAQEAGCHFISVNGPEVIQQHYGESEAHLRRIFEEAQQYPASIIFLDEVDAIAPNRETVLGDVEKRVVAQLLSLMDGLNSRGQVVVIAATNLPNNIDPALRRPGRFDREIAINPPDRTGRHEILRIHTRSMPLADDVDLEQIAKITHGFLGADLAALCREAAMLCARDVVIEHRLGQPGRETGISAGIRVAMHHFERARGEIDLSTTRQVVAEIPSVGWSDVGGLEQIRQILRDVVEAPLRYGERFRSTNISPPTGVLLTGRPGTGKTLVARALAAESGINFIAVNAPELLSKWVGDSEKGIRDIFKRARQAAPVIVYFDEIDSIAPVRGRGEGGGQIAERMVGQFLLEMDAIAEVPGVVVLAASNRPDLIDPALKRPGRFDLQLELPLPDNTDRRAILDVHCAKRPLAANVSLDQLAERTAGMTGAQIASLCNAAAMQAISASIAISPGAEYPPIVITADHFAAAFAITSRDNND